MEQKYQICARCVMDTSATDISFDENGFCNFCSSYLERSKDLLELDSHLKSEKLKSLIEKVKKAGMGKKYDCIVGVSGGADSSWTLVKAVEHGLRPLAVHMDNGWNSELSQNNIYNLVKQLNIDLHTHVIDWEEYRKMMQAFFDANVIDVELLYDNAMLAVNYKLAAKYNIKYILSGSNQSTEGIYTPRGWNWYKFDKKNIKSILKKHGRVRTKTFPFFSTIDYLWYEYVRGIKWLSPLDLMEYNKENAMKNMSENYGYKIYSHKHYESIFTRFYQGYLLLKKFNVDKRRLHLSVLVVNKQMTRDEALHRCEGIAYPDEAMLEKDKVYFLKKMQWSEKQLDDYISSPIIPHQHYNSEKKLRDFIFKYGKLLFTKANLFRLRNS